MLSLERLGNLTAELSANLVRSLVWPAAPRRTGDRRPEPHGREDEGRQWPPGCVVVAGAPPLPEDAVVACIRFLGGRQWRAVVLPVCGQGEEEGISRSFRRYGIAHVEVLSLPGREAAMDDGLAAAVEAAQVAVVCGPDPARGQAVLAGTPLHGALARLLAGGKMVVGVGGGGVLLADRFLVAGQAGALTSGDGLGFLPGVALAWVPGPCPHPSRLLHGVGAALGSRHLGLILDPQTALIARGGEALVAGEGAATCIDARDATAALAEWCSGAPEVPAAPREPAVCGLRVHVLVAGYGLNLVTRRPLGPARSAAVAGG